MGTGLTANKNEKFVWDNGKYSKTGNYTSKKCWKIKLDLEISGGSNFHVHENQDIGQDHPGKKVEKSLKWVLWGQ